MVTIYTYVIILTSVIFGDKLQTIDQNVDLFLQNCKWCTLCISAVLGINSSRRNHMRNTEKQFLYLPMNLQKNNFSDLTFKFWQVQKHVQHSSFCLCERYIFSTDLLMCWHRYGQHIYICHDTYKCNFWHEL